MRALVGHHVGVTTEVLLLLLVAFATGLVLTAILCRVGRRLNTMDSSGGAGELKQLRDVPNIGGIAVAWPLIAAIGSMGLLASLAPDFLVDLAPSLADWSDRLAATAPTALALAGSLLILHVIGLIDDRCDLPAVHRLLVQVGIAIVLATFFDVRLLQQLDTWGAGIIPSVVVTVVWIVVVTNAMNFLDNMDGLTSGVTVIAGGLFMVAAIMTEQWFVAGTLAILVGTTAGFLLFNVPPAKIFLGDGGSLVIGLTLAVLTVRTTYWEPTEPSTMWYGMLMPLFVLAIPLYDIVSVTILRVRQGRSPFAGDHQHFSHRLVSRGVSQRRAVCVIWALTAMTGIVGLMLPSLEPWQAVMAGVQVVLVLAVLAMLETGTDQ
jgi:UDP-GlcNAc:undecaprenyl-phosphate GlcNAc-1-phosphate transferase